MTTTDTNETTTDTPRSDATEADVQSAFDLDLADEGTTTAAALDDGADDVDAPAPDNDVPDRQRIEDQLLALRQREAELRRELAKADHPQLAEAIRELEGGVYRVGRADAKLADGLTKSEQRKRETLHKKITALQEKRDQLDAQIAGLQEEFAAQGEERIAGYRAERREALERLVATLGAHGAALTAAQLEATVLLPELDAWMPEIRAVAEDLASARG